MSFFNTFNQSFFFLTQLFDGFNSLFLLTAGYRYNTIISKCMAQWKAEFEQARVDNGPPDTELVSALVDQLFVKILERLPTAKEADQYASLTRSYVANMGNQNAIEKLIQTLMLRSDFVYRYEFGQGEADGYGRRMLSPRDASYAIAYALTDSSPDTELVKAVQEGRLSTREDYKREVWKDSAGRMGLRMTERVRDEWRKRWLKIKNRQ